MKSRCLTSSRPSSCRGNNCVENPDPVLRIGETDQGVRFGLWGCESNSPVPTLFILANTIEGTLASDYFRQCGTALTHQGWQCVSIDLPCHGLEHREGEPQQLDGWRFRADAGENFVAESNQRLAHVLDHLIANGRTDAAKVAVCGTSRGGFLAMHFAAFDPRVKCIAAFAPVTDLLALREFHGAEQNYLVRTLALTSHAAHLAQKQVWMVIGDQDARVGTDCAIALADRIAEVTHDLLSRAGAVELHVLPEPRGHTTPAGSADQAMGWIRRQISS
jgi:dienelactone hydrolase